MLGKGRGADELAFLALHRLTSSSPDLHRHAEAAHLDFAAPHRPRRIAKHEAGNDVRLRRKSRLRLQVFLDGTTYT